MRSNTFLKMFVVVLIIFFSLKALSELAYIKGADQVSSDKNLLKISTQIFPLMSDHYYSYGSVLLDQYIKDKRSKTLDESRKMLLRSLSLNNLNFSAHFLLGKSYLASESSEPLDFEKGLSLIKNASSIRKTNLGINIDTIKVYLSLWPFLDKEAKDTASSLMKISIPKIKTEKFTEIIEAWGFYSKDPSFLNSILNKTGRHYKSVHNELLKHELDLKFRHKLMAQSEYLIFKRGETDKIKYADDIKKTKICLKGLTAY